MIFPLKLSLIQKIFLLVLLPIILELAFLAGLGSLLQISEEQVAQEVRRNAVNSSVENLIRYLYSSGTDILASVLTDNPDALERYAVNRTSAEDELKKIERLTSNDPEEQQCAQRLKATVSKITTILDETRSSSGAGGTPWRFMKTHRLNKQLQILSSGLLTDADRLRELEHKKHFQEPRRARATKDLLKQLIWVAAGVNVLLAALFAFLISRDMVRRLNLLMENARSISARKSLPPLIQGSDEISQLDRTLHLAADELLDADKRRTEAEKLRSDFVSMLGHDLRTPLTVVQASLYGLTEAANASGDTAISTKLADTAEEVQRLVRLTEDLLDVSLINSTGFNIERKPVDSWVLIKQAVRSVDHAAAAKNITLVCAEEELTINCDRDRIVQVLVNLLINAIQAAPENSQIIIAVIFADNKTTVSITDSGPGIPDESKELIFEKFNRLSIDTSGNRTGLGLGLAVCRAIVLGHGGEIGVKDSPQGGSCFWFSLP